jgi:calcium-dependent protein kinase
MSNVDYAGNGKINYSEFLSATIEVKHVLTEEKLWAVFKYFDIDNSGFITSQNLKEAFAKTGKVITDKDIERIMENHSIEKTGSLSFHEFGLVFFSDPELTKQKTSYNLSITPKASDR